VICLAPRAPGDSVRPRHLAGVVARPLNFTVRRHMRLLLYFVAALIGSLLLQPAADADELRLSGLRIDWLDGFTLASKPDALPLKLIGRDGETALFSVLHRAMPYPAEQRDAGLKLHEDFAHQQLVELAKKKGDLVIPLERAVLADGDTLYSTGTQRSRRRFYLQFFLISRPELVALVTIEGNGDVETEMKRFRPLFDTVSWDQ
jgi:hypothetical protein